MAVKVIKEDRNELLKLSADLRRVSYWPYDGRIKLAEKFLDQAPQKYASLNQKIGCYQNIWQEIRKISQLKDDHLKASEKALTASLILQNHA